MPVNVFIDSVLENNTAQLISKLKTLHLGIAQEADLAQSINPSFAKIIGIVSELDNANTITSFSPARIGQAPESDLALSVVKPKFLDLGLVSEVDIAQAILLGLIAFYDGDTKIFTEVKRGYNFTEPKRGNTFEEKL